jgi:CRP-like cAMP-binding protein
MFTSIRPTSRTDALEARLASYGGLRPADLDVLRACGDDQRRALAGTDSLNGAGEGPRLLVSGWAGAAKTLADGRRQILHIYLPGDVVGLALAHLNGSIALSDIVTTDASPLAAALLAGDAANTGLRTACAHADAARQGQLLDQILRLGQLSAHERTAHLMMELAARHLRAGLSDGRRMAWPLTQETLADVVGLSVVHVNRILHQLRSEGVIALRAGQLVLPDADRLALAAVWEG